MLWTVAFLVDYGGGRIATAASFGEVRSGAHFAERHGLVLIIVLGESLLSAGAGAGQAPEELILRDRALLALSVVWGLLFLGGVYVGH